MTVGASALRRAFVAVAPPPAVLAEIDACVTAAREHTRSSDLRWTRREQWHATLQFLGRVDDLDLLVAALEQATAAVDGSTVRLGGGGAFPDAARGSVLWLGAAEGVDALTGLAAAVAEATAAVGFSAARGPYLPHVTLARSKKPRDLSAAVDLLGSEPVGPAWRVGEVVLLQSETHPEGARYSVVRRFPLGSR
jgi:2'-5' RNA ligase